MKESFLEKTTLQDMVDGELVSVDSIIPSLCEIRYGGRSKEGKPFIRLVFVFNGDLLHPQDEAKLARFTVVVPIKVEFDETCISYDKGYSHWGFVISDELPTADILKIQDYLYDGNPVFVNSDYFPSTRLPSEAFESTMDYFDPECSVYKM